MGRGLTIDRTSKVLPAGCEVQSVEEHGKTNWSSGFKVEVLLRDCETKAYFMKVLEQISTCKTGLMLIDMAQDCRPRQWTRDGTR